MAFNMSSLTSYDGGPHPFVSRLYLLVDDSDKAGLEWLEPHGDALVLTRVPACAELVKSNLACEFVDFLTALRALGFRKERSGRIFAHRLFRRGREELLPAIKPLVPHAVLSASATCRKDDKSDGTEPATESCPMALDSAEKLDSLLFLAQYTQQRSEAHQALLVHHVTKLSDTVTSLSKCVAAMQPHTPDALYQATPRKDGEDPRVDPAGRKGHFTSPVHVRLFWALPAQAAGATPHSPLCVRCFPFPTLQFHERARPAHVRPVPFYWGEAPEPLPRGGPGTATDALSQRQHVTSPQSVEAPIFGEDHTAPHVMGHELS